MHYTLNTSVQHFEGCDSKGKICFREPIAGIIEIRVSLDNYCTVKQFNQINKQIEKLLSSGNSTGKIIPPENTKTAHLQYCYAEFIQNILSSCDPVKGLKKKKTQYKFTGSDKTITVKDNNHGGM